jgi:hypothetical protein
MNSGMIGKIEKAHRYAGERERFQFEGLQVSVQGDNTAHTVTLRDSRWGCDCDFFAHNESCAHTMALGLMLEGMAPNMPPVPALT